MILVSGSMSSLAQSRFKLSDGSCAWIPACFLSSLSNDDVTRSWSESESSSAAVPPAGRLDEVLVEQVFLILLGLMQAGEVLGSMLLGIGIASSA